MKLAKREADNKRKNNIFLKITIICIILVSIIIFFKKFDLIKEKYLKNNLENNILHTSDIVVDKENIYESKTIENEKLVLKSNFEEDRDKRIFYFFKNNIVEDIFVLEKYYEYQKFAKHKENYEKRTDIELISIDEEKMEMYYGKKDFGNDTDKSFKEIAEKYTSILGAYEIVK